MKEIFIKAADGYDLCLNVYECDNPKAVVQIIHGMEEHQERYFHLAKYLYEHNFIVVTSDIRGHGKYAKELGYFGDKNGHLKVIDDQRKIRDFINESFPNLPVYLFGHSMGSIISRNLLQTDSNRYSKVVLCGYPPYQFAANLGVFLSSLIQFFKGPYHKSKILYHLSIGSYNRQVKNPKTPADWLTYNQDNIKEYLQDPLCGFGFTVSSYKDLFKMVLEMNKIRKFKNVNTSLPFLLISGEDDPCVLGKRGTNHTKKRLEKIGFKIYKKIDYPKMRHEILGEEKHFLVYNDILTFFDL